jgi:hypothetical protein
MVSEAAGRARVLPRSGPFGQSGCGLLHGGLPVQPQVQRQAQKRVHLRSPRLPRMQRHRGLGVQADRVPGARRAANAGAALARCGPAGVGAALRSIVVRGGRAPGSQEDAASRGAIGIRVGHDQRGDRSRHGAYACGGDSLRANHQLGAAQRGRIGSAEARRGGARRGHACANAAAAGRPSGLLRRWGFRGPSREPPGAPTRADRWPERW